MKKNNKRPTWETYMSGNVGNKGYYILDGNGKKVTHYGPFKTKEFAEFFNFIAFGSPRDQNARLTALKGVVLCDKILEKAGHPRTLFASNSKFSLWLQDLYGKPLTTKLVLEIAKESGAKGYKSFTNWIICGSKINGAHLASRDL